MKLQKVWFCTFEIALFYNFRALCIGIKNYISKLISLKILYFRIEYFPNLHTDSILGLRYLPSNKTVITISRDPIKSLVIRNIHGKFDSYVFKLDWGVRCFDHVSTASLSLVVTGR